MNPTKQYYGKITNAQARRLSIKKSHKQKGAFEIVKTVRRQIRCYTLIQPKVFASWLFPRADNTFTGGDSVMLCACPLDGKPNM